MDCFVKRERERGGGARESDVAVLKGVSLIIKILICIGEVYLCKRDFRKERTAVPICINNVFECRQMSVRCTEVGEEDPFVVVFVSSSSSSFIQAATWRRISFLTPVPSSCILRNAIKLLAKRALSS